MFEPLVLAPSCLLDRSTHIPVVMLSSSASSGEVLKPLEVNVKFGHPGFLVKVLNAAIPQRQVVVCLGPINLSIYQYIYLLSRLQDDPKTKTQKSLKSWGGAIKTRQGNWNVSFWHKMECHSLHHVLECMQWMDSLKDHIVTIHRIELKDINSNYINTQKQVTELFKQLLDQRGNILKKCCLPATDVGPLSFA